MNKTDWLAVRKCHKEPSLFVFLINENKCKSLSNVHLKEPLKGRTNYAVHFQNSYKGTIFFPHSWIAILQTCMQNKNTSEFSIFRRGFLK